MVNVREAVALYDSGLSQREVGQALGYTQAYIGKVLRRAGVTMHPPRRRYSLNESYFDQVDTPEKAYWLGFLAADGYVLGSRSGIGVTLATRDGAHLEALAGALGSTAPAGPDCHGRLKVHFHSMYLMRSVAPLGIVPDKSHVCEPWDAPQNLAPHYWRGLVDGDGHVSKAHAYISYCGTQAMVGAFRSFAHSACGTNAKPFSRRNLWILNIQGSHQVRMLAGALYGPEGPVLRRKHEAALALIARYPPAIERVCLEDDCGAPHYARDMCRRHYREWHDLQPMPECSVGDCSGRVIARNWCSMHYARWRAHGDPLRVNSDHPWSTQNRPQAA